MGDIPLGMQVKLLRLLETGTYRRVGSTELRKADIRVVSATHRSLREMVAEGSFRQDLYYRLNTFPIAIPPLRERVNDIALLARGLLERLATPRPMHLSAAAEALLCTYPFPGNVRELRNVLERASLMCDGEEIGVEHLARGNRGRGVGGAAQHRRRDVRGRTARPCRPRVRGAGEALAAHSGSRKALAQQLGISERTLYRKLRACGIGASA